MRYYVGVDIGGTFTDAFAIRDDGVYYIAKVLSTPPQFEIGFTDALRALAQRFGITLQQLLENTTFLGHGTTVGTNTMLQRSGSRVALLVTKGHKDALKMMCATGRTAGLSPEALADTKNTSKPDPLVEEDMIFEINERIDVDGDIVVPLKREDVEYAIEKIKITSAQSVGIAFLWSFVNPRHELDAKSLVANSCDDIFISTSHELSPQIGEYERTVAVAVNCYIGPETRNYLFKLQQRLQDIGYNNSLYVTQCAGGVMDISEALESPIKTLQSGPVAGVNAASKSGGQQVNIITADMGGTSFDVSIIVAGHPLSRKTTILDRYEYLLPTVDIQSIGAGGGSIAWFDRKQGALKVGPRSAGANPGPACYGRGGKEPTVTDADLYLGYLNADYFLGGNMKLNKSASDTVISQLADEMGLTPLETAAGIKEVVDRQMGDLIRRLTIGKGYDPRDFVLFAFGGAGPVHAAYFARDIGVRYVVVPGGAACSVWSAYGAATSDLVRVVERACYFRSPFPSNEIKKICDEIYADLMQTFKGEISSIVWTADMHYVNQISELEIELPDFTERLFSEELIKRFQKKYEQTYGKEAGFHGVDVEVVALRGRALKLLGQPPVVWSREQEVSAVADPSVRSVYWPEYGEFVDTPVYRNIPHMLYGPLIVELPVTSVVVHPGQSVSVDEAGNIVITLGEG